MKNNTAMIGKVKQNKEYKSKNQRLARQYCGKLDTLLKLKMIKTCARLSHTGLKKSKYNLKINL